MWGSCTCPKFGSSFPFSKAKIPFLKKIDSDSLDYSQKDQNLQTSTLLRTNISFPSRHFWRFWVHDFPFSSPGIGDRSQEDTVSHLLMSTYFPHVTPCGFSLRGYLSRRRGLLDPPCRLAQSTMTTTRWICCWRCFCLTNQILSKYCPNKSHLKGFLNIQNHPNMGRFETPEEFFSIACWIEKVAFEVDGEGKGWTSFPPRDVMNEQFKIKAKTEPFILWIWTTCGEKKAQVHPGIFILGPFWVTQPYCSRTSANLSPKNMQLVRPWEIAVPTALTAITLRSVLLPAEAKQLIVDGLSPWNVMWFFKYTAQN